jgi:hypothetical protein
MPSTEIPTEAIDRIVESVGPAVAMVRVNDSVVGPPDPNKDLGCRLHQSLRWYYVARERRSDADKKLQVRRLTAIVKTGSKLRNLLKPDQEWEWLKDFEFEIVPDQIGYLLSAAERVIYELEMKIEWGDDYETEWFEGKDLRDRIRMRSPFEWLAGTYLADDYRVCFGKEPTLNRATDGKLRGPFIQFVEQVLIEFDVKNGRHRYGREAIANALIDARKGR